jgi:hypothetical protein
MISLNLDNPYAIQGEIILNNFSINILGALNLHYLFSVDRVNLPNLPDENIIYCIHNNLNNKNYIGKAVGFFNRFLTGSTSHKASYEDYCENGGNTLLYKALYKYTPARFTVYILEELGSESLLNDYEKYWIKKLHTCIYDPDCNGYNMTWGGEDNIQLNSIESHAKSINTRRKLYGDPAFNLRDQDVRDKASTSTTLIYLLKRVNKLKSNGLNLTPKNYISLFSQKKDAISNINIICDKLYSNDPINERLEWSDELDKLFRWFDSFSSFEDIFANLDNYE